MEQLIDSEHPDFNYKILKHDNKIFYKCDPTLNTKCDHKQCSYNKTGPCEYTQNKEFAMLIKKKKITKSIKDKK